MLSRTLTLSFAALTLAGCAMGPTYRGASVTDAVLRADIYKTVHMMFDVQASCRRVDTVDTRIVTLEKDAAGGLQKVHETWNVSGCATSRLYDVTLRADGAGETFFSVSAAKPGVVPSL